MIFPPDSEMREYSSYYIRAVKIFKEEFRNSMGRDPTETEISDFARMGIIPFGILKQNGSQRQGSDPVQNAVPQSHRNPLDEIGIPRPYHEYFELKGNGRIHLLRDLPKETWGEIKDKFSNKGYKWDWSSKNFEKEGAKA